jgi:predicted nucleotidyltransferase
MLSEMQTVFIRFEIDYFLVGAFARDMHFSNRLENLNFRRTNDIDLAVCINHEDRYNEVIDALIETGLFVRDEKEIIKLYYKGSIEVDLIPFGEIENEKREVKLTKPIAFTLQMPGFLEAAAFT